MQRMKKIAELRDVMATLKWEIWEMFSSVSRATVASDEWEREVIRRVAEYPKLDYEYEMSFVRSV